MKMKIILAAAVSLLLAHTLFAQAAPACTRGTLASYIALGTGGCMFDNVLYDNFTYAPDATSATDVSPETILVTPILLPTSSLNPGLNFSASWNAAAGKSKQSVIGYRGVPYPPYGSSEPTSGSLILRLGPTEVFGIIGSVTVVESTSATSTTDALKVYDICADACSFKQIDSVTILPVQTLQTTLTVSLSGGSNGVSLSSFASDYAIGPQPQ